MSALPNPALLLAALAVAVTPSVANGQCRLCDKPVTSREEPGRQDDIRLEVETKLNFDRLILLGAGAGSVLIHPDGTKSSQGAVAAVGARAMVGTVTVHGQAGRAINVELPRRIELYSLGGGRITVDEVTSDLPSLPRLDSAGALSFRIGGRVIVSGDADGDYRGDLPIDVDYQ